MADQVPPAGDTLGKTQRAFPKRDVDDKHKKNERVCNETGREGRAGVVGGCRCSDMPGAELVTQSPLLMAFIRAVAEVYSAL